MNKTESRLGTRFKTISMHMTHMYIVPPKPYEERTSRVGGKFIRLHLDYGDIVYDRPFNESFHKNLESIQYNAAIAVTEAVRGTCSEKLFQELRLESLQSRRWLRKLCLFYKMFHEKLPRIFFS